MRRLHWRDYVQQANPVAAALMTRMPLEEQLRALSSEQLEQLAEALLEFNAISDLETWLRQGSV